MRKLVGLLVLVASLSGCGGSSYLPYAPNALTSAQIDTLVAGAATSQRLPAGLIRAVLMSESAGNPSAVSSAGAEGLMQVMPGVAAGCGISDPFDPQQNVACGSRYLRGLLARYHGDVTLAVAAYNAGPGAVDKYGGVPPYAETRAYVTRVITAYRSY
ncbi:MAG TPA: lytic transglycosylase domain-containing protein [Candidatus Baltobacteraceae bacterium]|jgi:soluble lytic murein transglycosylase-like protein